MGTLFSRTEVPLDPISIYCNIKSRHLSIEDPRYITRDPVSHNFYFSNSIKRESILLTSNDNVKYVITHPTRFLPYQRNPFVDKPTLFPLCLLSRNIMLIAYHSDLAFCSLDGELISHIRFPSSGTYPPIDQIVAVCADSLDVIYVLSRVNYRGVERGEITEISCRFEVQERFMFGVEIIQVPRDMCKQNEKIFILHESDKCVLVFSTDGVFLSALVSGVARDLPNAVQIPVNLAVTSNRNIILSNWGDNTISFISKTGNVIANISLYSHVHYFQPSGLFLDEVTRVLYCVTRGEHPQLLSIKLPDSMSRF